MNEPAIVFDGVWKKFSRGERHDSLRDLIPSLVTRAVKGRPTADLNNNEFWAIRDASFKVEKGKALGIIGSNGAGKSTTLKLLTRILRPSKGRCAVHGRVGALIEIAAGFHPELTGRENVFLQGAIMGMRRAEIARKLDAIVDFAGVGDFIDTPVKRYSSGMNARLGFAIAAHLDPNVLLIDEVLGVGDVAFQMKCVERMKQFKRDGVAIAFVSHNLQAVANLCEDAVLLKSGQVAEYGEASTVLSHYVRGITAQSANASQSACAITHAQLLDASGGPIEVVRPGDPLRLVATFKAAQTYQDLTFGFYLYRSTDQLMVYDGNVHGREIGITGIDGGSELTLTFLFRPNLTRGHYHLGLHLLHNPTGHFLARLEPAGIFSVSEERSNAGVADLDLHVEVGAAAALPTAAAAR